MAIPNTIDVTIADDSGNEASFGAHVQSGFTLTQYQEVYDLLAPAVDDMIAGIIVRGSLTVPVDISGLTVNNVEQEADVEEIAAFSTRTAQGRPVRIALPGPTEDLLQPGSDDIDAADPSVAPIVTMLESGIAVTGPLTIQPSDIDSEDIVNVATIRKAFRASGAAR